MEYLSQSRPADRSGQNSLISVLSSDSLGIGRAARFAAHEGASYSLFACYAFTINYILGVGSLGMPYAAWQCGWAAGLLLVGIVSLLSYVTVIMVARTALRAEMLVLKPCEKNPIGKWCYVRCIATVGDIQLPDEEAMCGTCSSNCEHTPQAFEVVQLCDLFLGRSGRIAYQMALVLLMYAGLLAYTLVFVTTMSTVFHISRGVAVLICAAIMVPFSMLDLTEMVPLQVTLSVVNILSLLLMGGIGLWTALTDPDFVVPTLEPVKFEGLGLAFSTVLFSQLFQHSVPGLINPLTRIDRQRVPFVFAVAMTTTAILYVFLSVGCVFAFSGSLEQSVNVNFANFKWRQPTPFLQTLSHFCGFYPAIATVAVFPLITVTLGNNLCVVAPLPPAFRHRHHRKIALLFRLLAAVPPIVVAFPLKSLSLAFKIAGLGGIWVAFVTPTLLQVKSKRAVAERFDHLILERRNSSRDLAAMESPILPPAPKRHPIFPRFNQHCWNFVVIGVAVLAFVITTVGIVEGIVHGW